MCVTERKSVRESEREREGERASYTYIITQTLFIHTSLWIVMSKGYVVRTCANKIQLESKWNHVFLFSIMFVMNVTTHLIFDINWKGCFRRNPLPVVYWIFKVTFARPPSDIFPQFLPIYMFPMLAICSGINVLYIIITSRPIPISSCFTNIYKLLPSGILKSHKNLFVDIHPSRQHFQQINFFISGCRQVSSAIMSCNCSFRMSLSPVALQLLFTPDYNSTHAWIVKEKLQSW